MKTLVLFLAFVLNCSLASAQMIDCPNVGKFLVNGDAVEITYSPKMGFSDNQDIGYFISMDRKESVYQANKWGAVITIPNTLIWGLMQSEQVIFTLPETADRIEECFSK